jgi:hypothetical protein
MATLRLNWRKQIVAVGRRTAGTSNYDDVVDDGDDESRIYYGVKTISDSDEDARKCYPTYYQWCLVVIMRMRL